jgi:hypothetical protein
MKVLSLALIVMFATGCSLGTNPSYVKLNDKGGCGDFLVKQAFKDDILCVASKKKKSGVSCFYVQDGNRVISLR